MPAKRRPGRFRRWLLRPAIWGVVVALTVFLLVVQLVLDSDYARWYARNLIERTLESYLHREVDIEAVEFDLLPLSLEVRGLTVDSDREGDPPFAIVDRVLVDADVGGWRRPLLTLRGVRVERPRLYLDFRGPQDSNMLRLKRGPRARAPEERPLRLAIAHLEVVDGELLLEQKTIPLDITAHHFEGVLAGGEGFRLQGRATAQGVEIQLPNARPFVGSVGVKLGLERGRGRILDALVMGPEIKARVRGEMIWKGEKEVALDVEAEGRAAFFREIGYLDDKIQGPFRLSGGLTWQTEVWGFRGDLTSPALDTFGRRVERVEGMVSGDRNGIRFDIREGRYGGGNVRGVIEARTRPEERTLEVNLLLDGVGLQQILDDQRIPVEGLLGRVSGVFDYKFSFGDADRGRGWADLKIEPVERRAGSGWGAPDFRLPVRGAVPLIIEDGVIRTEAGRLASGSQRVLVAGRYEVASSTGRFEYEVSTEDVGELALLLPLTRESEEPLLWLPESGRGELAGELLLGPEGPSTHMRLDLLQVAAPGVVADELRGGFTFDRRGLSDLRLDLLRPDAGMIVTGSLPATEDSELPFELALDAAGWPAGDAGIWLPFNLPLEGRAFGSLILGGAREAVIGRLEARIEEPILAGIPADSLDLDLEFDPGGVRFHRADLDCPAGGIRLAGGIDSESGALDLALDSDFLDLSREPLSGVSPGELGGGVAFTGELTGTREDPNLAVEVRWRDPVLAGRSLPGGEVAGTLGWDGQRLDLVTQLPGVGRLEGGGRLDQAGMDLEIGLAGNDLEDLVELATGQRLESFGGSFHGRVFARADFATEEPWDFEVVLDELRLEYRDRKIRNLEVVELRLTGEALEIQTLFLGEEGRDGELIVAGSVGLAEPHELDLYVETSLGLLWFDPFLPDLGLRAGRFDALARVTGDVTGPEVNGQGMISKGRMVSRSIPHALEDIQGAVLFYPTQLIVDNLSASVAGGTFKVTGAIEPYAESGPSYRLQGVAENLAVRYPEGWLMRGDAELVLASTPEGRMLRGTVELDRAFYLEDVQLGLTQVMQGVFGRQTLEVEETSPLLAETSLNLSIVGPGALRVRNNLADLRGDLDLLVRGSLAQPVVFGRVDIDPGGTLVYGGNEYEIGRGQLSFANPFRIEPVVDLVATTEVREYDVTLNLDGTLDRLNANFASDPPLANLDVLALLTTGEEVRSGGNLSRRGGEEDSVGAEGLLYGQASSLITERVNQLFGLDRFRIDPLTGPSGDLSAARVTVGKRLSRDVFATYSYDPSTTQQQILQLEWQVSRGLTLILTQNGDDSFAVDVRWEKSF